MSLVGVSVDPDVVLAACAAFVNQALQSNQIVSVSFGDLPVPSQTVYKQAISDMLEKYGVDLTKAGLIPTQGGV